MQVKAGSGSGETENRTCMADMNSKVIKVSRSACFFLEHAHVVRTRHAYRCFHDRRGMEF